MMIEPSNFIDNYRILKKVAVSNLSSTYIAEHTPVSTTPILITLWHGIQFTTSEDTQTFLKKAKHGVIFRNQQRIPILDAQLYHQSPYIVTAFNEQASATLDTHTKFIDHVVDNRRALHPDEPHASIDAFLYMFCTSSNTNLTFDFLTANKATSTAPHIAIGLKQWQPKPPSRRIYIIASIVLLLVLLIGGTAFLVNSLPANTATVTITPQSERITHTYAISLVTGNPTTGQVKEHAISYTTPSQSQTVPATGQIHHDATKAQGQVEVSQIHLFNSSDNNSSVGPSNILANDGTVITIDAFTATEGGSLTVNASAAAGGQAGNISPLDINGLDSISNTQGTQIGFAYIQNTNAFTGGQDASDSKYVQQQDIDGAANPLAAQLTPTAQQQAQQQLQPSEQLVQDITCSNTVNTDHQAQDTADTVTVTVQVTCTGIAYNPQDLLTAAINAQKADETTRHVTTYQLSGAITTGTPQLSTSSQSDPVIYQVPTDGIWVFQIDKTQQQELAQSIAGRSQQDATNQLLQNKGIKSVVITTTGNPGSPLPTSPDNIKFTIVPIPGLTSH